MPSTVLGLELGIHDGVLRFYHPQTRQWLQPPEERAERAEERAEHAEAQAQQEARARQDAEAQAQQEARARREMEEELAKALAEVQRLQAESGR